MYAHARTHTHAHTHTHTHTHTPLSLAAPCLLPLPCSLSLLPSPLHTLICSFPISLPPFSLPPLFLFLLLLSLSFSFPLPSVPFMSLPSLPSLWSRLFQEGSRLGAGEESPEYHLLSAHSCPHTYLQDGYYCQTHSTSKETEAQEKPLNQSTNIY